MQKRKIDVEDKSLLKNKKMASSVLRRTEILKELRALMKLPQYVGPEPLHAYIVPSGDEHQSEYLADCDKRRAFISGFTGSAGTAIITDQHACLWTDGRYFLQASKEMSSDWTLMKEGVADTPSQEQWLCKTLKTNSRVGFDPRLISFSTFRTLNYKLKSSGISLIPVTTNLIDILWGKNQPLRPNDKVKPLENKYTGTLANTKIKRVQEELKDKNAEMIILTALDQIAWLLNLRGSDISFNPVFFSYASISLSEVCLFITKEKITDDVINHFKSEGIDVKIQPYKDIDNYIKNTVKTIEGSGKKIWMSESSSYALCSVVPDDMLIKDISTVAIMKTVKNENEILGMINCHIRDAAALCCYFAWLEKEIKNGKYVTEISGADKLEEFRKQQTDFVGLSFETISSVGPNAAIIHYKPEVDTDRQITDKEVYLCDSGGQFKDGTTDVTRTIHMGNPTQYERECFTRVFRGQYNVRTAIFPAKLKGNYLDGLARLPLWNVGLDYLHGTSHGIGCYLNVHEGPIGISWRAMPNDPGLDENMFLSNEPGYYEDGKFGIRIENIIRTVKASTQYQFKDKQYLTFDDVTVVPIQTSLLVKEMLTQQEIDYINSYHTECLNKVGPLLLQQNQHEAYEWLKRETQKF